MKKLLALLLHSSVFFSKTKFQRGASLIKTSGLLLSSLVILIPVMSTLTVSASSTINEYSIPSSSKPSPYFLATGPDGALWFTEFTGRTTNGIGRVTTSGTVTEYSLPTPYSSPVGITTGPDGALWFTEGGAGIIGRITTSGAVTEYHIPDVDPDTITPENIVTGPDGALWFTENGTGQIGRLTTSGNFTQYSPPSAYSNPTMGAVWGITAGPDGALWFPEVGANKIGRITTVGEISEYAIPSSNSRPEGIAAGSDGALWFTDIGANKIGRITTAGTITEYSIPTPNSFPEDITSGPDGALWFVETDSNKIARITITGEITEYSVPSPNSEPTGITTGPDGALWFAENLGNNIGQLIPNTLPATPTNLTIFSPVQNPSLSWTASSGASSYNIYRNSTKVGSSASTSYTDTTAPEGTDTYYVTAVNSGGESGQSNSVNVLVDRTAPTITYSISPTPNSNGWNNSQTTVTFTCTDNTGGSGIASCSSPQTESANGTYTLTGNAIDNAGNSSSVNVTANIDQTPPTVSNVSLTTNPLPRGTTSTATDTTTLTATVSDNLSGVAQAEYYIGTTDPGVGNGTPMTISNGTASATVGPFSTANIYPIYVRAQDSAGNWSPTMQVNADVFDPSGGYVAGHGSVVPNSSTSNTNPSDILPAESGNNVKANFDFTVKYASSTSTVPIGASIFTWGAECNSPHSNCFAVTTDTRVNPPVGSWSWLVDPGSNTATFQGVATLSQGTTTMGTNYPVRVTVTGTTTTSPGHYELQVYQPNANPDTSNPIYQASGDLTGGSVVMH